jgi:hypothetical protein
LLHRKKIRRGPGVQPARSRDTIDGAPPRRTPSIQELGTFMPKRLLCLALVALPLVALGDTAIPGPTLEATMSFIQDQLDQQGVVRFVDNVHDQASGRNWMIRFGVQVSDITADPRRCTVSYRWELFRDSEMLEQKDTLSIPLREVQKVGVRRRNHEFDNDLAASVYTTQLTPPVYLVDLRTADGIDSMAFHDVHTAAHVANAFIHAVELCGGSRTLY